MHSFLNNTGNSLLSLFLDQTNMFSRRNELDFQKCFEFFEFKGEEGGVTLSIFLQSKSSVIKKNFLIFSLEMQLSKKDTSDRNFQELTSVMHDDEDVLKKSCE